MFLDEVIQAQKRGEAKGITSICSAVLATCVIRLIFLDFTQKFRTGDFS